MSTDPPLAIPYNEAARLLNASKRTISRMVQHGELAAIGHGSSRSVIVKSIDRYLERAQERAEERRRQHNIPPRNFPPIITSRTRQRYHSEEVNAVMQVLLKPRTLRKPKK